MTDEPRCDCGHTLWAPQAITRGQCEHCHRYGPAPRSSRTLPYRLSAGYTPPEISRRNDDEPEPYGQPSQPVHHDATAHVSGLLASYPRCTVCGRPMGAGQRGTHLSCQPKGHRS
jgi:hypothetical protein